ncbi:hypothetical protein BJ508DRAFT_305253 [Ascobolus immersus RN42]|uniref:Uncharacterized protein n=1 Tax=Ascobolus immersus RN42 TaxID=1160509 RepID=A0A3N4IFL7_ASCIM|nr:hypothetical protein BJ508DRAFT_305253 [Ascobolus immersus RN42]
MLLGARVSATTNTGQTQPPTPHGIKLAPSHQMAPKKQPPAKRVQTRSMTASTKPVHSSPSTSKPSKRTKVAPSPDKPLPTRPSSPEPEPEEEDPPSDDDYYDFGSDWHGYTSALHSGIVDASTPLGAINAAWLRNILKTGYGVYEDVKEMMWNSDGRVNVVLKDGRRVQVEAERRRCRWFREGGCGGWVQEKQEE